MIIPILGALLGMGLWYTIRHPTRVLITLLVIVGGCWCLGALNHVNTVIQTERAYGLAVNVISERGVRDETSGSLQAIVHVSNDTNRDVDHFIVVCGEIHIDDATGLKAGANEDRIYEIGAFPDEDWPRQQIGKCEFSYIGYGKPEGFTHPITYGRVQ